MSSASSHPNPASSPPIPSGKGRAQSVLGTARTQSHSPAPAPRTGLCPCRAAEASHPTRGIPPAPALPVTLPAALQHSNNVYAQLKGAAVITNPLWPKGQSSPSEIIPLWPRNWIKTRQKWRREEGNTKQEPSWDRMAAGGESHNRRIKCFQTQEMLGFQILRFKSHSFWREPDGNIFPPSLPAAQVSAEATTDRA